MRKNIVVCLVLIVFTLYSGTIYAADKKPEVMKSQPIANQRSETTEKVSRALAQTRGIILAYASTTIFDEGKGVIGIQAATLCHEEVDSIRMRILLERYDEANDMWYTVATYPYDISAQDKPNGETLTNAVYSFDVKDQAPGYFYRVKGFHIAYVGDNNYSFSTLTDGIKISR